MEEQQIKTLLENGKLWDHIVLNEMGKYHIGDIKAREVLFLCSVGRLVKNRKPFSFNVLLLTPSSSGKDHIIVSVLNLFKKNEVWEKYGRISKTAINYLHSEDLNFNWSGKILYLPEITDQVLNNEVMKEFTSGEDSEEISEVAISKRTTKGIDIIEIHGKPEVFCSTAKTIPSEEIRNRFNIIGLDLSDIQTKEIFKFEKGIINENILKFLSKMKEREVKIPNKLKNFMIKVFPNNKIRYRRDFWRLEDFVRAFALFHNRTIATSEDYDRAKDIFINSYSSCASVPLKDIDQEIVNVLERVKEPMSAGEIHKEVKGGELFSIQTIYKHLADLKEKDILKEDQERVKDNFLVSKYDLTEEFKEKIPFSLPNYEE